jgi:glycosyltransferase involved in cell wall biosynthesis
MNVAVCILAKNEEKSISDLLGQLAQQSLVTNGSVETIIHVVANGCMDDTASAAKRCKGLFESHARLAVHELQRGGKSHAWNKAVHRIVDPATDYLVFLDADITLVDESIFDELLAALQARPDAEVCSGYPLKDISTKSRKSLLDVFSLAVSRRSQKLGAINGSLYVAKASALRGVWLPDETPGEDGFLNAMVTTRGFTVEPVSGKVIAARRPTHFYQAHGAFGYYLHERRMILGTIINIWIFEYLWSLRLTSSAGDLIRRWNESDPAWVERLIRLRSSTRTWLVPNTILFGRFTRRSLKPWWKRAAYLPIAIAATILTIPPAIAANARLKQIGAASTW